MSNSRLVYSTDYPHGDSRYPKAVDSFLELPISDEDKRKILWGNCARFYAVADAPLVGAARSDQAHITSDPTR